MGVTSVRLQPEIESPLEKLANKLDRRKNYLINQAIKEFLSRETLDEKKWNETLEALESVKSNKVIGGFQESCRLKLKVMLPMSSVSQD